MYRSNKTKEGVEEKGSENLIEVDGSQKQKRKKLIISNTIKGHDQTVSQQNILSTKGLY